MKTISIHQPWASLIAAGVKRVENRSRPTRHRGRVLIHAGLRVDDDALAVVDGLIAEAGMAALEWPTGAIVGCARIVDCVTESEDEFFEGPYGYVLEDAVTFGTPIPAHGQLGLYDTPLLPVAAVAAILGKSPTTIRAQLQRLGLGQKMGRDYTVTDYDLSRLEAVPPPGRPARRPFADGRR